MNDQTKPSELICVDPARIADVWPLVKDMIDSGFAAVDEPTPDVRTWLIEQHGLLWLAVQNQRIVAVLTTSLERKRGGLVCRMVTGAGSKWHCLSHLREIEEYAKAEGCVKMHAEGRPGWSRVLRGYKPVRVTVEKAI